MKIYKNKNSDEVLVSGRLDGGDFHYEDHDDCPICKLMMENDEPSPEELDQAVRQAKEEGYAVDIVGDQD